MGKRVDTASEHDEQTVLIRWWKSFSEFHHVDCGLLFSIPNGAQLGSASNVRARVMRANVLKSEGLRPGIPDIMIAKPNGDYAGLFIEMKRVVGGTISDEQNDCLNLFWLEGYKTVVCCGFSAACAAIKDYFKTNR